jgi:hypothetical protein
MRNKRLHVGLPSLHWVRAKPTTERDASHEEDRYEKLFAFGAVALASSFACAQTASAPKSSVQLWGIVDMAYRHTNNEGAGKDGLSKMIGGGMSQSRWGINVEEDLGGGSKALVTLENRFDADSGNVRRQCAVFPARPCGPAGPLWSPDRRPSMERPVRRRDQYLRFVPLFAVYGGLQA